MIVKLMKISLWMIVIGLSIAVLGMTMAVVVFALNGMTGWKGNK